MSLSVRRCGSDDHYIDDHRDAHNEIGVSVEPAFFSTLRFPTANWGFGAGRGNAEGGGYQHPNFARSALRLLCFPRTRTGFKLEMA